MKNTIRCKWAPRGALLLAVAAGLTGSAGCSDGDSTATPDAGAGTDAGEPPEFETIVQLFEIPKMPGCDAAVPFPHDPAVNAADGMMYYVDSHNGCIGQFDPEAKTFRAWPIPTAGSYPHGITVGPDGMVYITVQSVNDAPNSGFVARFDPVTEQFTEYKDLPPTDPHTPVFSAGALWFTCQQANQYGRLDPDTGEIDLYATGVESGGGFGPSPYGFQIAPNGHLWIAFFGTNMLGEIDPAEVAAAPDDPHPVVQHPVIAGSTPRRLAIGADGRVWYSNYGGFGSGVPGLGLYDPSASPPDNNVEWPTPNPDVGSPYGIMVGPDNRIWYNDDDESLMVAFDPATQKVETFKIDAEIPDPESVVRNMEIDKQRQRLWLAVSWQEPFGGGGEDGVGRIGMIQFPLEE